MTHGTRSGYNSGCRCPECTEANTAASRARRERIAEHSTTSILAKRPRQRVEATADSTWAPADVVPDFPKWAKPEPAEVYPAQKPSSSGLFSSGLFSTPRFGPRTTAPARSPAVRRRRPLFGAQSPGMQAQAQAQRAAAAKAIDDYYRRLSFWLAGKGENPDLQDARRIYGPAIGSELVNADRRHSNASGGRSLSCKRGGC